MTTFINWNLYIFFLPSDILTVGCAQQVRSLNSQQRNIEYSNILERNVSRKHSRENRFTFFLQSITPKTEQKGNKARERALSAQIIRSVNVNYTKGDKSAQITRSIDPLLFARSVQDRIVHTRRVLDGKGRGGGRGVIACQPQAAAVWIWILPLAGYPVRNNGRNKLCIILHFRSFFRGGFNRFCGSPVILTTPRVKRIKENA